MLADYYARSAIAASQVLAGFNESAIRERLEQHLVGLAIGPDAAGKSEGHLLVEMLVRLLARMYPVMAIRSSGRSSVIADEAASLARRINPNIEFSKIPSVEIVVGASPGKTAKWPRIFVGSDNWMAYFGTSEVGPIGTSSNPLGAGAAACFAAANLFRLVFQAEQSRLDKKGSFSTLLGKTEKRLTKVPRGSLGEIVLVGAGAIGNAAAWSFSRLDAKGVLHLVDHETIELGNLQRYVLTERQDEHSAKVDVLARHFEAGIEVERHGLKFDAFVSGHGYAWDKMLLALDSARDRRAAQASLPRWIANAWTQPGDLGVSVHDFRNGACVCCLYLPDHALENEDQIVSSALGIPGQLVQVRTLLHNGAGVSRSLLEVIAASRRVPIDVMLPFEGRPIRSLYVEGFCGGAVIPLGGLGTPRQEIHVPLPHQSALAGILLASACVQRALRPTDAGTTVTRTDLMQPLGSYLTQPAAKDPQNRCICQDDDYRAAYVRKYGLEPDEPGVESR